MSSGVWQPKVFREFSRRLKTSMWTCEITTDAGPAYIKCLGNSWGPHALVCDWLGSRLAEVMGLETLDFAILRLDDEDVPFSGGKEEPGPSFVSRSEENATWSGSEEMLRQLCNPGDLAKLVVLDTLLRNKDRHPPNGIGINKDNVFLSQERCGDRQLCLIAMDFSHAITYGNELTSSIEHIDHTKDEQIYGLFEQFVPFITPESVDAAIQALGRITDAKVDEIISELPTEWEVGPAVRRALRTFLTQRRDYLLETLRDRLSLAAGPQTAVKEEKET